MHVKSKIFLQGIVAAIVCSGIVSCNHRSYPDDFGFLVQPEAQTVQKRIWHTIHFGNEKHSGPLGRPLYVKKGPDNKLYVSDYGYMKVIEFNELADSIRSYGKGRGKGPGEFLNIVDVSFSPDCSLWVTDNTNAKTVIFKADTFKTVNLPEVPSRVIPVGNQQFASIPGSNSIPVMKNLSGTTLFKFDSLFKNTRLWRNTLSNGFIKDGAGGFLRLFFYFEDIVRYNSKGHVMYFREPVDPPPFPPVTRLHSSEGKGDLYDVNPRKITQTSSDFSIVGNQIHVLVAKRTRDTVKRFVDVFSLETGNYLYSYHLPQKLWDIAVASHYLAGIPVDSTDLVIWNNKQGW